MSDLPNKLREHAKRASGGIFLEQDLNRAADEIGRLQKRIEEEVAERERIRKLDEFVPMTEYFFSGDLDYAALGAQLVEQLAARLEPGGLGLVGLGLGDLVLAEQPAVLGHVARVLLVEMVLPAEVDGGLPDRLGGVGVKEHASLPADSTHLLQGLEHSDLVVRRHDGDENGSLAQRVPQRIEVHLDSGGERRSGISLHQPEELDAGNVAVVVAIERAIRPDELDFVLGITTDLPLGIVEQSMVIAAQRDEVVEIGATAVDPVHDVMDVHPSPPMTAWEPASSVAGRQTMPHVPCLK